MLYCPKCQQTYQEGVQRFCSNDGGRLLPAPSSGKLAGQPIGVFTTILNRKSSQENDLFSSAPRFSELTTSEFSQPPFHSQTINEVFKAEPEIDAESPFELDIPIELPPISKPLPRLIRPSEIPTSQARLGDRKTDPMGRLALTRENPKVLIGQTVKGRYQVVEQISADESGINYLAEDKIAAGKKVVVRILMDEEADDTFANKIFAEERVSLSHVNHPNIASVIDSGELLEGKPFIVTENVEGESVKDFLGKSGQFNALRTARIIRQASYALSEVHQSGVLHRNLKPENIILTVNESGAEQVKLINFGASKGKLNEENLPYKSPEQVEGKLANFASDEYALAVIAFQMLTNRLPFNASTVGKLLKAQREGLTVHPTNLRLDLPAPVDKILEKALAFNPSERYPKVRDFGDAFFNVITDDAIWEKDEAEEIETISESPMLAPLPFSISDVPENAPPASDVQISPPVSDKIGSETRGVKATEDLAWEKRSSEMPNEATQSRVLLSVLGIAVLLAGLVGVWYYFINRSNETNLAVQTPIETVNPSEPTAENLPPANLSANLAPTPEEIESPPLPRSISQPSDTVYFQNSKENLKGDAMKNFLGFSLYYPQNWTRSEAKNNFLDISKTTENGLPIEQMLISYYNSKGTFKADAEIFPQQVKETNATLKKIIPNYEMISEGKKTVNNGWQAYEVKFKGTGKTATGENITLWGRRLFIPTALRGVKNGYVITMLATSLSKDVKSVDDVGVKGELSNVLETFEPNQNF